VLWAYGKPEGVPEGAQVRDANEIMPLAQHLSSRQFASFFRYSLLFEKGGWWADTDVVCLRPFDFGAEHAFASESTLWGGRQIGGSVMKAPVNSQAMAWCMKECLRTDPRELASVPAAFGPPLLERMADKFGLHGSVAVPREFCPLPWWKWRASFDGSAKAGHFAASSALHLWRSQWRRNGQCELTSLGFYGKLLKWYDRYGASRPFASLPYIIPDSPKEAKTQAPVRPVILIMSCLRDVVNGANQACRETWLAPAREGTLPVPYRFVIGRNPGFKPLADEIVVDAPDDYEGLPWKGIEARKWALSQGFTHVFKCDTDTYVHIPRLLASGFEGHGFTGVIRVSPKPGYGEDGQFVSGGCGYWTGPVATRLVADSCSDCSSAEDVHVSRLLWRNGIRCWSDWRYSNAPGDHGEDGACLPTNDLITVHLSRGTANYDPGWMREAHRRRMG
jgi:hypothetical protein